MILAPKPSQTFTAFTLPDGRRAGLCTEEKPKCVHGHTAKTSSVITDDGIFTCEFVARRGAPPCGTTLYAALLHMGGSAVVRGAGHRLWIVIELTSEKVRYLRSHPMTLMERLVYLNATLPGVEVDILRDAQRGR
jgi:hypothetical protein